MLLFLFRFTRKGVIMKSSSKISNRSTQSPSLCFWTASAVLAFLVLVGLPIPSSATNATQTLTVAADNFLKKDSRNGNRGDYTLLKTDEDNKSHILLRFDQSQIAAALNGRTLISASLQLYIVQNWGGFTTSGKEVDVYRMTGDDGDWTEMGSTWNCPIDNISNSNADCAVQWDGGTKVSTATDHHQWYDTTVGWAQSFDVTSDVNLYMNGTPNYGWLVRKLYSFETGSVDL
jgi:hypothetical protein